MNPLLNEWYSFWIQLFVSPFLVATMYDRVTVEKQLKLIKGEQYGK